MVIQIATSLLLENGNVYEINFIPTKEEIDILRQTPENELAMNYRLIGKEQTVTINDLENGE